MIKIRYCSFKAFLVFLVWVICTLFVIRDIDNKIVIAFWGGMALIGLITRKKEESSGTIDSSINRHWKIILLYVLCSTVFNFLLNRNYANSIIQCITLLILPYAVLKLLKKKSDGIRFFVLVRNFLLLCCMLGFVELIFKVQIYKPLITNPFAINNFNTYGDVKSSIYTYRTTLFFYHPIFYSVLLSACFAIILYKPFKSKFINSCSLIFVLAALICTQSRSGWMGCIVVLVLHFIDHNKERFTNKKVMDALKIALLSFSIGLIIIVVAPQAVANLIEIVSNRLSQVRSGNAFGARLANLNLVNIFVDNNGVFSLLIGGGRNFGSHLLASNTQIDGWSNAIDNQYITIFLDYGILGVYLFVTFYIKVFLLFLRSMKTEVKIACCIIVTIAFESLFFEYFNNNTVLYFFMICILECFDEYKKKNVIGGEDDL